MSGTVCDCGHPEAQHLTLATSNRCAVAVGSVGGKAQVCGCLGFEELSDWERERRAAVPFLTAPAPAADPGPGLRRCCWDGSHPGDPCPGPAPSLAADVCACGCDVTDHGLNFGCIRCRNCTEFAERSTYVPLAERPSPSPAAEPPEGHTGPKVNLDGLIADWLCKEYGEFLPDAPDGYWEFQARELTGDIFAPLLAQAATDRAAVELVEILLRDAERFPEGTTLNRVSADNLRRALSGDAR